MTLNIVLSFVVLLAVIAAGWAVVSAIPWVAVGRTRLSVFEEAAR